MGGDKMNTIAARREANGYTQMQLAQAIGVTQGAVSQWESGTAVPRSALLLKIAELLHCTVDDLLREDYNISTVPKNGLLVKS